MRFHKNRQLNVVYLFCTFAMNCIAKGDICKSACLQNHNQIFLLLCDCFARCSSGGTLVWNCSVACVRSISMAYAVWRIHRSYWAMQDCTRRCSLWLFCADKFFNKSGPWGSAAVAVRLYSTAFQLRQNNTAHISDAADFLFQKNDGVLEV